jgi:hypothetical protein
VFVILEVLLHMSMCLCSGLGLARPINLVPRNALDLLATVLFGPERKTMPSSCNHTICSSSIAINRWKTRQILVLDMPLADPLRPSTPVPAYHTTAREESKYNSSKPYTAFESAGGNRIRRPFSQVLDDRLSAVALYE